MVEQQASPPIVVGVDDSDAARQADVRHCPVHAVTVLPVDVKVVATAGK